MKDAAEHTFDPTIVARLGRLDWIAESIVDGLRQGIHRSTVRGFSTEFSDFKPYTPGDDIRLLDWRIYARTEKPYVRRFEAETSMEVSFLVDSSQSMSWRWEKTVSKQQYAASLVAGMTWLFLSQQDQVGVVKVAADGVHVLAPSSRRQQLDRILALLETNAELAGPVVEDLLAASLEMRITRGQVVLVSDLEETAPEAGVRLAELRGMGHDVMVVHLLDQAEITLPFPDGTTHLRDHETGEMLRIDLPQLRLQQTARVRDFRRQWQAVCQEAGVVYVPVDTGMDYVSAILTIIESRRSLGVPAVEVDS
ncbi:MAG: DUF58 domain-containing protein [Victivallales bacterium]|nr:DUF58 domain-containing protein [Victivallales bacterium]MBT7165374.1 DUF58 domain-containing protein [Victivallales bacterium]MBT7299676.1 DUF58 domain-containing protein [Victivallales bacterium]